MDCKSCGSTEAEEAEAPARLDPADLERAVANHTAAKERCSLDVVEAEREWQGKVGSRCEIAG
ncbi:MAG: hypothetical protein C4321_00145, partial [Chloroflexota bacterium]